MRFGLIYHHQLPRPWTEDSEERILKESLEQIELADRLGFDYAWATEHHFLEEYSHSGAPEVFLAAAAARTKNIRLAHGVVQLPTAVNHPVRVAERIATLDLISGGRVDFGTGAGSSQLELAAFGIDRLTKKDQWKENLEVVTRLLSETPFTGHEGTWTTIPPRNLIPKSKQKPHPPLWLACSARTTIEEAARHGLGALSFSFVTPEEAKDWVESYYAIIASSECVPIGKAVNPNFSVALPFMCARDEATALDRGLDGAHFFSFTLMHYFIHAEHHPGKTDIWAEFQQNRAQFGLTREPMELPPGEEPTGDAKLMLDQISSLRRGIGTPDQIADMVRRYEAAGVDQIILEPQVGNNKHEHIMEALELFATEVMPEFTATRAASDAAKQDRLAIAVKEAEGRVREESVDVADYVIVPEVRAG